MSSSAGAPTTRARWCALGGIIGPAAFVTAWSVGGAVASHYSPIDDAISHLAAIGAPTRALMTSGFIAFGIALPTFAVALREAIPGRSWLTAAASGVATLAVAAAPLGRSHSGDMVHGAFAGSGYVALALTPILAAAPLRRAGRAALARASVATGAVSALSLLASTTPKFDGFFQRFGLTVVDIWIVTIALEILRGRLTARRTGGDTRDTPFVVDTASALVSASAQVLEGLAGGRRPLNIVSTSLADLAATLGVEQVIVAIDDDVCGRQVFSSARTLLGDRGDLLSGPPRACTDPPSALDDTLGRLIVAVVAAAFERARNAQPVVAPPDDLVVALGAATDRSARYGWGFTLVMLRLDRADDRSARQIGAHLRASDTLVELDPREFGILMPAAGGDDVPRILARIGHGGAVSTFCYGLAACPGDASEAGALLALATARLRDADELRTDPKAAAEVHALEQPKV